MHERLRDAYALLVTARQPFDKLGTPVFQVGFSQSVIDAGGTPLRRNIFDTGDKIEVGLDRHIGIERRIFRQVPDPATDFHGFTEHIEPRNPRGPGRGRHIAGQDTHRGRFPGAVGPQKTENLTLVHCERNMVHGCD